MRLRDAGALALSTLRCSPARTLMTMLGLAVGVAAVLTVRALGAAGETEVEREIARMGVNKVWITADGGAMLAEDSAPLVAQAADVPASAGAWAAGSVGLDGRRAQVQIVGYDGGMEAVHGGRASQGRMFTAEDHRLSRPVCMVDQTLNDALGGNALGRRVEIGGRRLLVVGIVRGLAMPSMAMGSGMAVLPLSTWQDTFGHGAQELTLLVAPGRRAAQIADAAMAALGGGFSAQTLENEIDAARQIVRIFVMVLSCVAAVCMVTGGVGVMNVLMASVRERRREIGLLKALGATSGGVGLIFLLEAGCHALLGGVLGTALGAGMIGLFGAWIGLETVLTIRAALPVVALAGLLGVLSGVVPALRAAAMEVVDAFRAE